MSKFDKPKPKFDKPRRAAPRGDYADPYQKVQRPARAPSRGATGYAPRPPRDAAAAPARARPRRDEGGYTPRPRRDDGGYTPRPRRDAEGEGGERAARGFTVTLDPDVARVFRGDASVNKALRLVLQLMQVVQGPPPRFGARGTGEGAARPPARRGYQGSDEARGFTRKPRFAADDEE